MTLLIQTREDADVPALVDVLTAQQSASGYPFRWPLPFPAEQFVVRAAEERAWAAFVDDQLAGQVAVLTAPDDGFGRTWSTALGLPVSALACVGSFFVDPSSRGHGVGRALLDQAVRWIRDQGRVPVLDVLPGHAAAVRLYEGTGWRDVGRARPPWLPASEPPVVLDPA